MDAVLARVLAEPGIPAAWRQGGEPEVDVPVRELAIALGPQVLRFVLTVSALGSPADVTFGVLWLVVCLPADEASARALRLTAGLAA